MYFLHLKYFKKYIFIIFLHALKCCFITVVVVVVGVRYLIDK